jgi:hypothetical protein
LTFDTGSNLCGLLSLRGDDECAPVQGRLRDLVDTKIADAQKKAAELGAFTAERRLVAATLGTHTPAGPCDDSCGCEHRGVAWIGAGIAALAAYRFVATLQEDSNFGRILAAYGGMAQF